MFALSRLPRLFKPPDFTRDVPRHFKSKAATEIRDSWRTDSVLVTSDARSCTTSRFSQTG